MVALEASMMKTNLIILKHTTDHNYEPLSRVSQLYQVNTKCFKRVSSPTLYS